MARKKNTWSNLKLSFSCFAASFF